MIEDRFALACRLAAEVEVTVIGKIDDRCSRRRRAIVDAERILVAGDRVCHRNVELARIALIHVGRQQIQPQRTFVDPCRVPNFGVKAAAASMQRIALVVALQLVPLRADVKHAVLDAIRISADRRAKVSIRRLLVVVQRRVIHDNVLLRTVAIRHEQLEQRRAVIRNDTRHSVRVVQLETFDCRIVDRFHKLLNKV